MITWRKMIKNLASDLKLIKKELLAFFAVYFMLSLITILVSNYILPKVMHNNVYLLLIFLLSFVIEFLMFANQFVFQRSYSIKKNIPVNINTFWKTILHSFTINFIQILIVLVLFIVILTLVSIISLLFMKNPTTGIYITGFIGVIVGMFWIYRLVFVPFILQYKRINYKARNIIKESIYLIRSNLIIVLPLLVIPVILVIPLSIKGFTNLGINKSYLVISLISIFIDFMSTIILINICVTTINEHKYCFLLQPEDEKLRS